MVKKENLYYPTKEFKKRAWIKNPSIYKKASEKEGLRGILGVEDAPLVSSDYIGNSFSAVVDASLTMAAGNLVKIIAWYDKYGMITNGRTPVD